MLWSSWGGRPQVSHKSCRAGKPPGGPGDRAWFSVRSQVLRQADIASAQHVHVLERQVLELQVIEAAADDRARGVIVRRLRRALAAED